MSDYLKLLDKGAGMVGLDDELALILALAEIAKSWRDLVEQAKKIDGAESAEALLAAIVTNVDDPRLDPLFKALPGARAKLKELLAKLGDLKGKIPDKYWKLLEPLSKYEGGEDGKVDWALSGDKKAQVGGKVTLGVEGNAKLQLDAAAKVTIGGTALSPLLRIGANGDVKATGEATLPIRWGSFTAGVEASVNVGLDYYYDPKSSTMLYGVAVAERIVALPDPFDFDSIWKAFQDDLGLTGIVYSFKDVAKAKADLALGVSGSFDEKVLADLKFTLGAGVSSENNFLLTLRAKPLKDGETVRKIEVILGRGSTTEIGVSAGIVITVDISPALKRVRELLNEAVARSDAVIGQITPYLTPGTWLRDRFNALVEDQAKKLISDASLRSAVVTDLKLTEDPGDSALVDWLSGKLTGAIDGAAKDIVDFGNNTRDMLIDKVADALPDFLKGPFRGKAKVDIAPLVDKASAAVKAKLEELIALPDRALGRALHALDDRVSKEVKRLDQAVAPIRDLIDRYNKLLHQAQAFANDAAHAKISATIKLQELWKWGDEEKIVGTFEANTADTHTIFEQITGGDVEKLKDLILGDGPGGTEGFDLDKTRSSVKLTARRTSKADFELILFGFGESGSLELVGDASILIDGDGKIQIDADGKLTRRFRTKKESREVSFVDTYDLLLAKKTAGTPQDKRSIEVGVGISHIDKSLELGEVRGFVASLAGAGLVSTDTVAIGAARFQSWLPAGASKLAGDIGARLQLTHEQVRTLMQIGARDGVKLTTDGKKKILAAAVAASIEAKVQNPSEVRQGALQVSREFGFNFDYEHGSLADFIFMLMQRKDDFRKQYAGLGESGEYKAFKSEYGRMEALIELIEKMGEVYLATPHVRGPRAPGSWDVKMYADAQNAIANSGSRWLQTGGGFLNISKEVAPATIAFLAAVCDLVGIARLDKGEPLAEGIDAMALTLTKRAAGGDSVAEEVTLTQTARGAIPGQE